MSHFVGIVFTKVHEEIDEVLSPFDENLEVDPYRDKSPDELTDWALEMVEGWRDYIAKNLGSEDKYCHDRAEELQNTILMYNNFESPKDYKTLIEKYHTLDDEGYSISTYNPQSQWDWYSVGGRWNGDILHAGSYDTNQARKEELTQINTPYCFVDLDGIWHERGEMGWWGMSFNEQSKEAWEKEFREYLKSVPDNTLLTVIDFHI